jgi:uncharacterized membrane protein YfcA
MSASFIVLLFALALVAFLYSSVGHGGASGYLALMAVAGIAPAEMKSSALVMNLAVSLISFLGFYRAGFFRWRLFLPFAIASVPMAYVGGMTALPDSVYKKILAVCLLLAIARMLYQFKDNNDHNKPIPAWAGLLTGSVIGLISGMIGIGGGILLSPILLIMRWASIKETAAASALFIFVNSLSGLAGQIHNGSLQLTANLNYAIFFAVAGGIAGAYYGSTKFQIPTLRYLLSLGLLIASIKLILT